MDAPAPDYGKTLVTDLRRRNPNVVCVFFRNKNQNIVVCEAVKTADSITMATYWLDIDPAYRKVRRNQGVNHDRVELSQLEYQCAYGVRTQPIHATSCEVRFNADPSYLFILIMDNEQGSKLVFHRDSHIYRIRSVNIIANDALQTILTADILQRLTFNVFDETSGKPCCWERLKNGELLLTYV